MNYRGLFIGLTSIDIQYFVDEYPEPNCKVKTNSLNLVVGGPATNAAVAFAKLNGRAFLASPTGKNAFTSFFEDDFNSTHISHYNLRNNRLFSPVIASIITSTNNGDRNIFTHSPVLNQFDISPEELVETVKPDILLMDGFFPEFAEQTAKIAKTKDIPVVMDCGSWKNQYETLLKYSDIVICSSDFYPPGCKNSEQVFGYLQNKNVKYIAISRGAESIIFQASGRGEIRVRKSNNIIDTLGAGDFLHGAFCYHYLVTDCFEKALIKASELATYTCEFKGTRDWLKLY